MAGCGGDAESSGGSRHEAGDVLAASRRSAVLARAPLPFVSNGRRQSGGRRMRWPLQLVDALYLVPGSNPSNLSTRNAASRKRRRNEVSPANQ